MLFLGMFIGTTLAVLVRFLLDRFLDREISNKELVEAVELHMCWRAINLAVGDGFYHDEACPTLRGLREAGYTVEKFGSERSGAVMLRITAPVSKGQA